MKTQVATFHNERRSAVIAKPVSTTKPVWVLSDRPSDPSPAIAKHRRVMQLLCGAAILLPAFAAQAHAGAVLTTLYSFQILPKGQNPQTGLVQGRDGNFYGTTSGGRGGHGTVYKISTNRALTTLYSFTNSIDGQFPGALVQGSDGNFYGTTEFGGTNGAGSVFKISTNGVLTTLYSFGEITNKSGQALDGSNPTAGLVQGNDGSFYGTTRYGGTNGGGGTVFKFTTNGALKTLYSFTGGNDGAQPEAGLVEGSDGNFYGTTEYGGTGGASTVFQMTPAGVLTTLVALVPTNAP